MARPKEDLSRVTLNQLEKLTGSNYRTITKLLNEANVQEVANDGNSRYFDPKEALPVIFEAQGHRTRKKHALEFSDFGDGEESPDVENLLDPAIQSARLSRARTKKVEVEIDVMLKKLVPAEDVERVWMGMISASISRLRVLPIAIAPRLVGETDQIKIEEIIREEIDKIRSELKDYDPDDYSETGQEGDGGMGSEAETDSHTVGQ